MNERINQLYAESVMYVHEAFIDRMLVPSKVDLQFAELIVRECLYQCFNDEDAEHIARHFGIDTSEEE